VAELTRKEKATWVRTLAAETRTDEVGVNAQRALVKLLDHCADMGGWCDHEDCGEARWRALQKVTAPLWRTPR
jgi:hypothetical protein